jgi:cytochrome c-type biogenesis protein CcmH/NrfF
MPSAIVIVILAVMGFIVASVAFPGSIVWALPLALLVIGFVAVSSFSKRREGVERMRELRSEAKPQKTDFTPRDEQTLSN